MSRHITECDENVLTEISSALKEKIDLEVNQLITNKMALLANYVLVLLFEACVYAENEFGLKNYNMRRQQMLEDLRRIRWTEAVRWAEEW